MLCLYKNSFSPIPFYDDDIIDSLTCSPDQKNNIANRYFTESAKVQRDKNREQAKTDLADTVSTLEKELSEIAKVKINESIVDKFKL